MSGVKIDPEIAVEIARLERGDYTPAERAEHAEHEARVNAILMVEAEENRALRRASRECRCIKGEQRFCPVHTILDGR